MRDRGKDRVAGEWNPLDKGSLVGLGIFQVVEEFYKLIFFLYES
jgi:hypothetical protein